MMNTDELQLFGVLEIKRCLSNPFREFHIATVAIHEDFSHTSQVNDIAILKTGNSLIC